MALVIPEGFCQLAYRFRLEGDPEEMISTIGHITETDMEAFLEARADAFQAGFPVANIFNSYRFVGITCRVGQGAGPPVVLHEDRTHVGTAVGAPPPSNCAVLVRKRSALGGRAHRGRMYLPPIGTPESFVNPNGLIDQTNLPVIQAAVATAFPGDFQYILHDSETPGDPPPTQITSLSVDPMIATQRRRMR